MRHADISGTERKGERLPLEDVTRILVITVTDKLVYDSDLQSLLKYCVFRNPMNSDTYPNSGHNHS
jgi:hypothetical protein